jgi:hypothetical protein
LAEWIKNDSFMAKRGLDGLISDWQPFLGQNVVNPFEHILGVRQITA